MGPVGFPRYDTLWRKCSMNVRHRLVIWRNFGVVSQLTADLNYRIVGAMEGLN